MADPLISSYAGVICDLDGVVYRGHAAIPGAVGTLGTVIAGGAPVVFATNNASRPPEDVAGHLQELGLGPDGWSVVTSSQAAAAYLASRLDPEARVCAVGGAGVFEALTEAGLVPVAPSDIADDEEVEAVVQGLGVDVTWSDLAEIGYLVQRGAPWVATNLDIMLPTARGPAPGNGSLINCVRATTDAHPHVAGKPGADLYDLSRARLGTDAAATLAIGDRLETDIIGAIGAGVESLLVFSGASTLQEVAFVDHHSRPTYVGFDLSAVLEPGLPVSPRRSDLVGLTPDSVLHLTSTDDRGHALQAVVCAAWDALDNGRALSSDPAVWRDLEQQLGIDRG